MTEAHLIAEITHDLAGVYADADPSDWTADECTLVLDACKVVAYELPSLTAKIRQARAAKTNNTPRPVPTKPGPRPKADPSPEDPPPPPPAESDPPAGGSDR